jgi:hypothetical protein
MRRYHLFEFLDQSWLPEALRAAATRYLNAAYGHTPFPALWAAVTARVLGECGADHIVDIGSGSGGPMKLVLAELARLGTRPMVTLTDLYPVPTDSTIEYWPEPVRASCVPARLQGLRTLFLCLHHFAPAEARAVLKDAFDQRQAICIFEATSRTPAALAASLVIPFLVLLLTPSVRPLSGFQLFFTYLMPAIPLLAFWDGLVSNLRTYSMAELLELTSGFDVPTYRWECCLAEPSRVPYRTAYLVGWPLKTASEEYAKV